MKKFLKLVVGVFAAIGVLYVGLMLFVAFGVSPEHSCTMYPVMAVSSPDGKFRAEQEQEICSKDDQLMTTVWMSDGTSVNLGGKRWSIFRAPATQATARRPGTYEPLRLQLTWLNNSELEIAYLRGTDVQHSETDENGVKVRYQELSTFDRF